MSPEAIHAAFDGRHKARSLSPEAKILSFRDNLWLSRDFGDLTVSVAGKYW
jgi:hypothetical protein